MKLSFCMQINKPFYKLIHGYILVSMASLTQSNQSTQQQIQMQLSKKHITFSQFLAPFLKSKSNLEHFPKKHGPLAYIFPELRVRKTCLNKCLKSTAFEQTSTVNMLKGSRYYLNLHDSIFIILFHHSGGNWVGKHLLVIWEILVLFLNTLTADVSCNSENLQQLIQM